MKFNNQNSNKKKPESHLNDYTLNVHQTGPTIVMNTSDLEKRRGDTKPRSEEYRGEYMRDECRVVHSYGFRRLQGKTQILGIEQGDYHRNRLTHSIEVASISRSIAAFIKYKCLNNPQQSSYRACKKLIDDNSNYDYLITAIGLLHDIGHPPFAHGGEVALNFKMRGKGGFEGNAQTIRLLTKLERFTDGFGLNLTRRTLLGLLKYPASYKALCGKYTKAPMKNRGISIDDWRPPKCSYYKRNDDLIEWILEPFNKNDRSIFIEIKNNHEKKPNHNKTLHKSFDCSIMNIADDIAYSIHDIEDSLHFGLVNRESLESVQSDCEIFNLENKDWIFKLSDGNEFSRKEAIGGMIHNLINSIDIKEDKRFENDLLRYNAKLNSSAEKAIDALKKLIKEQVINSPEIQSIEFGGMISVMQLFDAILSNSDKLLPKEYKEYCNENTHRKVCDYIASMTDDFARRLHERLYGDNPRSVLEKL